MFRYKNLVPYLGQRIKKHMASARYSIPSLSRAIEVLELLARHKGGLSLAEITRKTDIPKSTLFRILATLQHQRCVAAHESNGKYRLGLKLWELGNAYLGQSDLDSAAVPYMKELAGACAESVFLGVLDEREVIYVRRIESPKSVMVVRKLGQRAPAYCTATGEAMLAFMPHDEVERIFDEHELRVYNPKTNTNRGELWRRLKQIRMQGVAVVDGEYNAKLLCVSAPILDESARPRASITVAMLSEKSNIERVQEVQGLVRQAAQGISSELGYLEGKKATAAPATAALAASIAK